MLSFIRLLYFASSNEEIGEIMLQLVDFAPLSEILFNRTLLWSFFVPEPLGFPRFGSSSKCYGNLFVTTAEIKLNY